MNKRIRELLQQAKKESSQWLGSKPATTMTYDELDKFAELIVRECAKSAIDLESIPDWYQDSVTMIPHHCSKNILKHFGVEE